MGYDCYVRGEEVPKSPRPDWDCREPFGGEEYDAWTRRYYFRRNIFGGSRLAEALIDMGMGFDAYRWGRPPEWPKPEEYGVRYGDDDEDEMVGERIDDYRKAEAEVLDWHGPEIPGIPTHKIAGSNDGWHVTREEAHSALLIYKRAIADGKAHPEAFSDDFIPFLREAARHDGFETH
jgi:hypothetical protein